MKQSENVIYETSPARSVREAFPLGNGILGALVMGEGNDTVIELTHQDLSVSDTPCREDFEIPFDGDYIEISRIKEYLRACKPRRFLPLGKFSIKINAAEVSEYKRYLDLRDGIASVEFIDGQNKIEMEFFTSARRNLLCFEIRSTLREDIELSLDMLTARKTYAYGMQTVYVSDVSEENLGKGYAAAVRVNTDGEVALTERGALVKGACRTRLAFAMDVGEDLSQCEASTSRRISDASGIGYNAVREEHIADVGGIFDRVSLTLQSQNFFDLSTSKRLKAFPHGQNDFSLVVLLFNMGRYLYTAAYRDGLSYKENLYGIWNLYSECDVCNCFELEPSEWSSKGALEYIKACMTVSSDGESAGIFPNTVCADAEYGAVGNLAYSASLYEMLINERLGRPSALPFLPLEFTTGAVKGIKMGDGRMADISWCDGRVVEFKVYLSRPESGK